MTAATITIRCSCGQKVRYRPDGNGLVRCPGCGSAHAAGEFRSPAPPEEIVHDFTRAGKPGE